MKLEELQSQLSKFSYDERAELTKEELKILKEMFSVRGGFNALFRYMCVMESEKGIQMAYSIEDFPLGGQFTDSEIAEMVKFKKLTTQFIRGKMEGLRNTFCKEATENLKEGEAKRSEELEKQKKEQELHNRVNRCISPDM